MDDKGVRLQAPADPVEPVIIGGPLLRFEDVGLVPHEIPDPPSIPVRLGLPRQGILRRHERPVSSAGYIRTKTKESAHDASIVRYETRARHNSAIG